MPTRSRLAARGSSATRTPSAKTVKASTVTKSSAAGSRTYAESAWYQVEALESIWPQEGVGGLTPMPRKDRPASDTMLDGSRIAA